MKRARLAHHPVLDDDDPLAGMVNLFDLAIVFAVGLIVALVLLSKQGRLSSVVRPSTPEIDVQENRQVVHYKASPEKAKGPGEKIGTAYRLPDGQIVYVPDTSAATN